MTKVVVIFQDSLPAKDGHLSQKNNHAVSWPGNEPLTESRESAVLTTTPMSHLTTLQGNLFSHTTSLTRGCYSKPYQN